MSQLKVQILKMLFLIVSASLVIPPVYADPVPLPVGPNWSVFAVEALVGETMAWLIGAEFLWRLMKKARVEEPRQASRSDAYKIMLLSMVLSFLVGLLIWKAFGLL